VINPFTNQSEPVRQTDASKPQRASGRNIVMRTSAAKRFEQSIGKRSKRDAPVD
jgi:hypothetical protein